METGLKDKVAVITGACSGMGLAASRMFAAEGAIVVVNDLSAAATASTVAELEANGASAMAIAGDVSDRALAEESIAAVVARFGRVDVLINNAGIATAQAAEAYDAWDRVMAVDLNAPFYWSQAVANAGMIRNGGVIINISSLAGLVAFPRDVGYIAAKTGLVGLTRALAVEWAKYNIRVNCICPGFTETQIIKDVEAIEPDRFMQRRARIPIGRAAQPEEIAGAMVFLASQQASFITGAILPVDGGQIAMSSGWSPG